MAALGDNLYRHVPEKRGHLHFLVPHQEYSILPLLSVSSTLCFCSQTFLSDFDPPAALS